MSRKNEWDFSANWEREMKEEEENIDPIECDDNSDWAAEMLDQNQQQNQTSWATEYAEKYQHPRCEREIVTASAPDFSWVEETVGLDHALGEMRSRAVRHEARRIIAVLTHDLRMRADEASLDVIKLVPFTPSFSRTGYGLVRDYIDLHLSHRGLTNYSVSVSSSCIRLRCRPRGTSSLWDAVRFIFCVLTVRLLYRLIRNYIQLSKNLTPVPWGVLLGR
eukprot:TRINITY_DN17633_c0_g1_i2.p1 TRINITY_DN17633_c0_g1~~TRINITY_DN17633_c0_g1_i2.p1  ORF type:complete len:220 (+),score=30.16 TRINITY_DN17633_c0_g1_i2:46-705(+)